MCHNVGDVENKGFKHSHLDVAVDAAVWLVVVAVVVVVPVVVVAAADDFLLSSVMTCSMKMSRKT